MILHRAAVKISDSDRCVHYFLCFVRVNIKQPTFFRFAKTSSWHSVLSIFFAYFSSYILLAWKSEIKSPCMRIISTVKKLHVYREHVVVIVAGRTWWEVTYQVQIVAALLERRPIRRLQCVQCAAGAPSVRIVLGSYVDSKFKLGSGDRTFAYNDILFAVTSVIAKFAPLNKLITERD